MASSTVNSGFGTESTSASENLAQNWWLFLLRGILGILFGVVALIFPGPTMLSLVLLFSAYTLVDGVAGIISAVRAIQRKEERWGWLIFEGAVNIAVAILAFLWPGMTVLAFVLLVAAWSIVSGALMTAAAFRLSVSHGRWWLVLGGLLSVGYGALLVATPLIGAIVLTWWMGAYAIAFGFALVILSFKLRLRQNQQINRTVARTAA
ncbi:HdeD family acid-resistance protein [Bradyrhizobium australafricanum]|uniref:HdeD family acid-resistance protein n=1 Tax=Bradyrhizobium australafricanum TaxID=2821406 RepID=UPI001CE2B0EB|nr:HdeD family acid-resistance protein [Bradyrhizobium australafricanum]MCA6100650.1 HdeD family acid-resistance protein [Bradyrhizobium australafricanum]